MGAAAQKREQEYDGNQSHLTNRFRQNTSLLTVKKEKKCETLCLAMIFSLKLVSVVVSETKKWSFFARRSGFLQAVAALRSKNLRKMAKNGPFCLRQRATYPVTFHSSANTL
jgi:hypothetical protein